MEQGAVDFQIGEELDVSRNAIAGQGLPAWPAETAITDLNQIGTEETCTCGEVAEQIDTSELPLKLALRRIDWSRSKCSWPDGDPKTTAFSFCGKDVVPGKPYCNEHCFEPIRQAVKAAVLNHGHQPCFRADYAAPIMPLIRLI